MKQKSLFDLDITESEKRKESGINRAVDHADKTEPEWRHRALGYLTRFPQIKFMAEDLRVWAYEKGLPVPPNCRAWGWVIKEAQRQKLISHSGYSNVKNPKAHRTPASVWVKI